MTMVGIAQGIEFGDRFACPALTVKNRRQIGARRTEIRRQLQRPAQQVFRILEATNARGNLGQHANGSDIERIVLEVGAQ